MSGIIRYRVTFSGRPNRFIDYTGFGLSEVEEKVSKLYPDREYRIEQVMQMVFRLVGGQMRRYANPIDEINATFAEENREALAGMRQWILNISKSGDSEEVKSKST